MLVRRTKSISFTHHAHWRALEKTLSLHAQAHAALSLAAHAREVNTIVCAGVEICIPKVRQAPSSRPRLGTTRLTPPRVLFNTSHRVAKVDAVAAKAAFSESGLWDYVLALAARSLTSKILVASTTRLLLSSALESASSKLTSAPAQVLAATSALSVYVGRPRGALGSFVVAIITLSLLVSLAPIVLLTIATTKCAYLLPCALLHSSPCARLWSLNQR